MHVVVIFSEKKKNVPTFVRLFAHLESKGHTVSFVDPNASTSLTEQLAKQGGPHSAPPSVVLHKVTDWLAKADEAPKQRIRDFFAAHPGLPAVDPLSAMDAVLSRTTFAVALTEAISECGSSVRIPVSKMVSNPSEITTFPVLVKPIAGCGAAGSHELVIARHSGEVPQEVLPALAEEFVPHQNTHLFKGYVIVVDETDVCAVAVQRTSISDMVANGTTSFNSQKWMANVSKKVDQDAQLTERAVEAAKSVGLALYKKLGLSLIGIDLLYCEERDCWYCVDVNYFPSYTGVVAASEKFEKKLLAACK